MKVIFGIDGTLTDLNVLMRTGISHQEAVRIKEKILNDFWVSHRFIQFIFFNRFRAKAGKYINFLQGQGVAVEIHSSRLKTCGIAVWAKLTCIDIVAMLAEWSFFGEKVFLLLSK